MQVSARSMLGHKALLKALNNIPWASDNDEYISIRIYQSTPPFIYTKLSISAYRKISTGSMFSDQTHTCMDNMPIQGHTTSLRGGT